MASIDGSHGGANFFFSKTRRFYQIAGGWVCTWPPVEDPVLAETDIDPVAHPDVELELCVNAFWALRGVVGVGKNSRVKTVVRANATKVRNAN